jgi:hypothetical protein
VEKMPEEEPKSNPQAAEGGPPAEPSTQARRSGRGRRGRGRRRKRGAQPSDQADRQELPGEAQASAQDESESHEASEIAEQESEIVDRLREGPKAGSAPDQQDIAAEPVPEAATADVSSELERKHEPPATLQDAIEQVGRVIDTLRESLDDMEEVLELLEVLERQTGADQREIDSLRRSLRQLQRPRDGGRQSGHPHRS